MRRLLAASLTLAAMLSAQDIKSCATALLDTLAANGMAELPPDSVIAFQRDIVAAVSNAYGNPTGLELVAPGDKGKNSQPPAQLPGSKTALLSIPMIDSDAAKSQSEELPKLLESSKCKIILLDLRNSGGDDPQAMEALKNCVISAKCSMGILVNSRTHALAETLAQSLKASGGFIFGQPTAGYPGARMRHELESGAILYIPQKKQSAIEVHVPFEDGTDWIKLASDTMTVMSINTEQP